MGRLDNLLKTIISSYICVKFQVFAELLFYLKGIPHVKYEKIDNACFFTSFTILDLIWLKFCCKTTPTLVLFVGFQ